MARYDNDAAARYIAQHAAAGQAAQAMAVYMDSALTWEEYMDAKHAGQLRREETR